MKEKWVPIFEIQGNEAFVIIEDLMGDTETEAKKAWIGFWAELMIAGMPSPIRYQKIDLKNIPHVVAETNKGFDMAVISGPIFEGQEKRGAAFSEEGCEI